MYQQHDWADEKRAALAAWAAHVIGVVEERVDGGNVVTLSRIAGGNTRQSANLEGCPTAAKLQEIGSSSC